MRTKEQLPKDIIKNEIILSLTKLNEIQTKRRNRENQLILKVILDSEFIIVTPNMTLICKMAQKR